MPDKPTIYRITHLWPNKQPGHGLTAEIEQDQERWTICTSTLDRGAYFALSPDSEDRDLITVENEPFDVVPAAERSSTVQIKAETDELNALPSRFVSLQDYERLERERADG